MPNKENRKRAREQPCADKYEIQQKLLALGTCDSDDDSDAVIVAVQC